MRFYSFARRPRAAISVQVKFFSTMLEEWIRVIELNAEVLVEEGKLDAGWRDFDARFGEIGRVPRGRRERIQTTVVIAEPLSWRRRTCNLFSMLTDQEASAAKQWATRILDEHGIRERFTVRVHAFKGSHLALYRSISQFSSGPIFWLPTDLDKTLAREGVERDQIVEVAMESILHEFGHVIAEWAQKRDPELLNLIEKNFPDEEEFAEEFGRCLSGHPCPNAISSTIDSIIDRYVRR